MANLKGPGSMKAVNLIVVTYDNSATKDGKSQYLDVQIDARDERGPGQTNLHLLTRRTKDKEGNDRVTNGGPYSTGQYDDIKETAGPTGAVALPKGAKVYAVKADVMPGRTGGLVLNTKTLQASDFDIDDKVIDNQFASVKEAKAAKTAAAEAAVVTEASTTAEAQTVVEAPAAVAAAAEAAEVSLDKADEPALA